MIHILLTKDNRFTIDNYLGNRGSAMLGTVSPIEYEDLLALDHLSCNTFIFTDLELISADQIKPLSDFADYLIASGIKVLNHPSQVLNRFELLKLLHKTGVNPHNVYHLNEEVKELSYPIFLRHRDFHTGPLSPLINESSQIRMHLKPLLLSGHSKQDLMIVEYVDTRSSEQYFRKYSAMKIGDDVIPRHLGYDDHWNVKANGANKYKKSIQYLDDWTDHVLNFPHELWVRRVFDLGRIDYGRLDYAEIDGDLVAWEINLNPDYGRGRSSATKNDHPKVLKLKLEGHSRIRAAFNRLNEISDKDTVVPINLSDSVNFGTKGTPFLRLKRKYKLLVSHFPWMKRVLQLYRKLVLSIFQ